MDVLKSLFGDKKIRTLIIEGELWFVAKDICGILGKVNPSESIKSLNPADRNHMNITDSLGRKQTVNIINEPGLYTLLISSKKQEAVNFRKWIISGLLPAIRKDISISRTALNGENCHG
jgi:prophage antirepressor-like protein